MAQCAREPGLGHLFITWAAQGLFSDLLFHRWGEPFLWNHAEPGAAALIGAQGHEPHGMMLETACLRGCAPDGRENIP